eukprot:Sspe_Gene.94173::Locus_66614_Transcript_1_1_Confidence_1.000_Length_2339::g.94173::m.94173
MTDGEAHYSTIIMAPFDKVWSVASRFDGTVDWLYQMVECCMIENGKHHLEVGAIRRQVFLPSETRAPGTLMREELEAFYDTPLKRYFTYRLLPYVDEYQSRNPLPCPFTNLLTTFSASPITSQDKVYVELYSTFSCESNGDVELLRQFLSGYFKDQLDALATRLSLHHSTTLPDVIMELLGDPKFEKYQEEFEKMVTMWRSAVAAERSMLEKVQALKTELLDNQAILQASILNSNKEVQRLQSENEV